MRRLAVVLAFLAACQRTEEKKVTSHAGSGSGKGSGSGGVVTQQEPQKPRIEQIAPPLDLKQPPLDAVTTKSGLIYKRLTSVEGAPAPKRNDTVLITYTGWRQVTGETFFSNRGKNQPMPLPLANTAPGFTEAMQLLHKGERAMLWLPPSIGYKGTPPPGTTPETLVYEVELVEIQAAPEVPPDVGAPPASAAKLKSGLAFEVVKPGTGKDKAHTWDTVTFNYSAWDKDGRMFDSTEMRKRPAVVPPFRQTPAMEDVLTSMTAGERMRVFIPSERMQQGGRPMPGMPDGLLTYEVEMITIAKGNEPPPVPKDLTAPPADARKTERGVVYKVMKQGAGGVHPGPRDSVKVSYTGWTQDGRMFDSSVVKGEPAEMSLAGVMSGWTDGIQVMSVGDRVRFWIPEELAYKGNPGRPQGRLVFDIELLGITPAPPLPKAPAEQTAQPAPLDVAAPPADAQKSPKGVFYKILKAAPGAPHPTLEDRVKLTYTGWTTDGKQFDSSNNHGGPVTFSFPTVIAGWREGIPLIAKGESARLWIPAELGYPNGGGPPGMLVFDIDMLDIESKAK